MSFSFQTEKTFGRATKPLIEHTPTIAYEPLLSRPSCLFLSLKAFSLRRYGINNHTLKRDLEIQFVKQDIDAIIKQHKAPETSLERFQRLTGINPCLCPVCKEGRMVSIRELPRIRSPVWLTVDSMKSHL